MSKVVVTGASGYIGRHVVKHLLDMGHQVVVADITLTDIDKRALPCDIPIFSGDKNIYEQLGKPDACIHLAWKHGFVHNSPMHMEELPKHITFLRHMIDGGLKSLSVMGTMHEVGYWEGAIDEHTPCNPQSQYGVAKNALRQSLLLSTQGTQCKLHWLRAYYITGDDLRSNSIFAKITHAVAEGKKAFPFTTGQNKYDFIDVNELAMMIAVASLQDEVTGIINVCTGQPVTLAERVQRFINEHGFDIQLNYGAFPDRPYDSPGVWGDATLIQKIMKNYEEKLAQKRNTKVFVTGAGGQLGHDVVNELTMRGYTCVGSDIRPTYSGLQDGTAVTKVPYVQLNLTDDDAVSRVLNDVKPSVVIHCAAWTAVDLAEEESNHARVKAINTTATARIAAMCKELDCKMVYLSTDYVFDGTGEAPWEPDCKAYAPLNYYGQTKLEGELAVSGTLEKYFIVRIAWIFGQNGKNFINTMLSLSKQYDTLRVVCDQIGTPTYTLDLARLLVDMIETEKYGYYHVTNEGGYISWAEFAQVIFQQAGISTQVIPVTTEEYGLSKAARPRNSRLDKAKLIEVGFLPLPDWKDALSRYLASLQSK